MGVGHRLVRVQVLVPYAGCHLRIVLVLVMFVVHMPMVVGHRVVRVQVFVPFGQVECHPDCHEHAADDEREGERVSEANGEQRSDEWRDREVGAGTCRADVGVLVTVLSPAPMGASGRGLSVGCGQG